MKKILIFLIVLSFLLVFPVKINGSELLPSGQIIESDFIRVGETVQIDGEIKGDAYLAGTVVTVNGKIDGDLFVLGGKVSVNGPVGGSIRILGADVTSNSSVDRSVLLVCANCTVTKRSTMSGSLMVVASNLEQSSGRVGRGFRFFGNRLYLNSEVANEAFVVANQEFLLGPSASISGQLKYTGNNAAILEPGATVAGEILYQKTDKEGNFPRFFGAKNILASYQRIKPLTQLFGLTVSALIGFVLLGLFPKGFEKVVMAIENKPYASLGWGVVASLMIPMVAVLFALTIVGIPVSLVLLLMGYVIWIVVSYFSAFFIGRKILLVRFGERRGWALVLGLVLIYVLGLIPIIGALIKLVLFLLAFGAIILSYKQPEIFKNKAAQELIILAKRGRGRPRK